MAKYASERKTLLDGAVKFEGAILAGGALTSVFTRQRINDFDLYFKTREAFDEAIRNAYDDGMWCVDVSKRSVTFASGSTVHQLMHFDFFPTAEDIFACFDFTCCMAAYDFDADTFVMHDDFLTHCSQRFLRFNPGTRYPLASAVRVLKYQDRGYTIGKGDMTRIALACRGVTIETWDDLKDQIGGAYGDKVAMNAEGDFSLSAALAALDPETLWTTRTTEDQPGYADDLLLKIAEMKGENLPEAPDPLRHPPFTAADIEMDHPIPQAGRTTEGTQMTHEEVTRWSAIENQGHLRYGQTIMMECLFGIIDGRTVDEFGFDLERHKEIERAKAWQEHNAVAARYAMKELFALIDMRAAELAPVLFLEAAE